jgi:hypothetical protein
VVAFGHQFVQRYQIGMRNIGERAKLSFETIDVRGLCAGQSFERDNLVHLAVVRFIHDPHAAHAETTAKYEALGPVEFLGGFNHVGISLDHHFQYVERCVIVPHMNYAINHNQTHRSIWYGFTLIVAGASCARRHRRDALATSQTDKESKWTGA